MMSHYHLKWLGYNNQKNTDILPPTFVFNHVGPYQFIVHKWINTEKFQCKTVVTDENFPGIPRKQFTRKCYTCFPIRKQDENPKEVKEESALDTMSAFEKFKQEEFDFLAKKMDFIQEDMMITQSGPRQLFHPSMSNSDIIIPCYRHIVQLKKGSWILKCRDGKTLGQKIYRRQSRTFPSWVINFQPFILQEVLENIPTHGRFNNDTLTYYNPNEEEAKKSCFLYQKVVQC